VNTKGKKGSRQKRLKAKPTMTWKKIPKSELDFETGTETKGKSQGK